MRSGRLAGIAGIRAVSRDAVALKRLRNEYSEKLLNPIGTDFIT
jgi:hypothetical protein